MAGIRWWPRYYVEMPRYAAIDIGSNSIRMQAAETGAGIVTKILAAERQVTRLGAGVFQDGRITAEALEFVCSISTRMAQMYQKLDVIAVRAVATSAVRDAEQSAGVPGTRLGSAWAPRRNHLRAGRSAAHSLGRQAAGRRQASAS